MRWQPITLDLATALAEHTQLRRAVLPTDGLLRFRRGQALTSRRYDHLWNRIGHELPWVAAQGISIHWLRHTTLTWGQMSISATAPPAPTPDTPTPPDQPPPPTSKPTWLLSPPPWPP
jgi:hypothetical protein